MDTPERSGVVPSVGPSLAIFDNLFPSRMSGFRLAEYTYLLGHLPSAEAWCGGELIGFAGTPGSRTSRATASWSCTGTARSTTTRATCRTAR